MGNEHSSVVGFRNVGEEEDEVALIVLIDYKRGCWQSP
jgi:hypothetical protein